MAVSGATTPTTTAITTAALIDDVAIGAGDWVDSHNIGAGQLLGSEVRASDGTKILKIVGVDHDDISLSGVFRAIDTTGRYRTPLAKRDRLIAIRDAAKPVRCVLGGTSFMATVRVFTPGSGYLDHVTYQMTLFTGVVGTPPQAATVSTRQQIEAHTTTLQKHAARVGPGTSTAASNALTLLRGRLGPRS